MCDPMYQQEDFPETMKDSEHWHDEETDSSSLHTPDRDGLSLKDEPLLGGP